MANIKVSELTEATEFNDYDYTMIVQSNQNKKITKANMFDGTAYSPKILWTNSNPTSNFVAQTITLSSDDYDMYEVMYYSSTTLATQMSTGRVKKGETAFLQQTYYDIDLSQVRSRQRDIAYVSDLSLNVLDAKNNGAVQNTDLIPAYVIGYKTKLFSNEGE